MNSETTIYLSEVLAEEAEEAAEIAAASSANYEAWFNAHYDADDYYRRYGINFDVVWDDEFSEYVVVVGDYDNGLDRIWGT